MMMILMVMRMVLRMMFGGGEHDGVENGDDGDGVMDESNVV